MTKTLLILLIVIFISCKTKQLTHELSINEIGPPAGTIKIADNLFIDETEITNNNYREFLYWIKHFHGTNSSEYKSMLPDTLVWWQKGTQHYPYVDYYLRHPAYNDYPVVGVSYDQVKCFSKWRSDRVMEYILVREGIIDWSPEDKFTIEDYFTCNYCDYLPNPFINYYPEYTLPDSLTFCRALIFSDSLINKLSKKITKRLSGQEPNCIEKIKHKNDSLVEPVYPIILDQEIPMRLNDNVRELTSIKNTMFGNSYLDSCKDVKLIFRNEVNTINAYTGFRNMCTFKRWK